MSRNNRNSDLSSSNITSSSIDIIQYMRGEGSSPENRIRCIDIPIEEEEISIYRSGERRGGREGGNKLESCRSGDTIDAIKEVCDDLTIITKPCRFDASCCKAGRYDP